MGSLYKDYMYQNDNEEGDVELDETGSGKISGH